MDTQDEIALERKIKEINSSGAPNAAARIARLTEFHESEKKRLADNKKKQQQVADARLKASLKTAFMRNPAATEEDFESAYPELKREKLSREVVAREQAARRASSYQKF
jgi:hypothetical protein